jgi:hypothetical protein
MVKLPEGYEHLCSPPKAPPNAVWGRHIENHAQSRPEIYFSSDAHNQNLTHGEGERERGRLLDV